MAAAVIIIDLPQGFSSESNDTPCASIYDTVLLPSFIGKEN
ncbi:uncharacterized protein YceK [Salibacterium salarium]|nr:uncharacterized protein YceK [Salibacterium salarium]